VISGTVEYMAPEQAQGHNQEISPKTDIFAIGGVLYFLLTGKAPFVGSSLSECLRKAANGDIDFTLLDAPGIPPRLASLCKLALAPNPEDRPASAEIFAQALEDFARPVDRRWILVGAAACIAVILFAITFFTRSPQFSLSFEHLKFVPAPIAENTLKGELKVSVWVGEKYVPLPEPAPLRNGAKIRVESIVPPGMHAVLVNVDSAGKIAILSRLQPQEQPTPLSFPEKNKKAGVLNGTEGTELFFLIARPGEPIDLSEITPYLDAAKPWQTLPDTSVLQLTGTKVKVILPGGNFREFTEIVDQADPEGEVKTSLEKLGKRLSDIFPEVLGVAARHKH
jgi:serine/threonine protein kinase